jgi:hypothetical protein
MKTEGPLQCPQVTAAEPSSVKNNPVQTLTSCFSEFHFNTIL